MTSLYSSFIDETESGELAGWMLNKIDFKDIEANEYRGKYKVEVSNDGLEMGITVKPVNDKPVDLTKLSTSEVREKYVRGYAYEDDWSTFTNPKTSFSRAYSLAEHYAEEISAAYSDRRLEKFPLDEVERDIYAAIREAIEENNETFDADGKGDFGDVIYLEELSQVSIRVLEFDGVDVIEPSNLLAWRNAYSAGEGRYYESWAGELDDE
jgi:hypothetical protein